MKGTVLECEINFKLLGKYEKGKTVTVHAMKACMESRVTTAFILNARHQMEVGGQIHVQADLPPGNSRYPCNWTPGGAPSRSGSFAEEKSFFIPP